MKVKDLIRELERRGWEFDRMRGSHRVYRHKEATRPVVVAPHGSEMPDIWAKSILKQAEHALKDK
ncbi:type II toxin-antitoxin system HicA family toxin [bacterium]|nr:type II toxin-antitoxin system HicA family toxin [bacterium]